MRITLKRSVPSWAACLWLLLAPAISCAAQARGTESEWARVQQLVGRIHGVSTTPPAGVITSKYSSGALLGNGDIGVVVGDSSTAQQSFHFGKSDFWGTLNPVHHNAPECNWGCKATILSLGAMTISSPGSGSESSVYKVDQDILHARVETTLGFDGATVHLCSWTADSDNLLVTRLTIAKGRRTSLPIEISLAEPTVTDETGTPLAAAAGNRPGLLWAMRENSATGINEYKARAAIAVRLVGARLSSNQIEPGKTAGRFELRAGTPVWIVTAFRSDARTGLGGPGTEQLVQRAIDRVRLMSASQIDALERGHEAWWKQFWRRSFVEVHDQVLEDYYYGALYVLGATIRPGKLAPSLFGNFITTDKVAWGGIYFMNYNEQAPYYGVFSSNHAEMAESYNRMVLVQLPWQRNLTAAAGYKGLAYQRVFAPFTEMAKAPVPIAIAAVKDYRKLPADQKSNATFSFLPLIQYYEYTGDKEFLQNKLYPALKELDAFWRDYAVRDPNTQHWSFVHSAAHEGGDDVNPNLDLGFARRVERELIETSRVLGVDAQMRPMWQEFLDELSPYPGGVVNGKQVYYIAESVKNRSHDLGTFEPGDQPINLEGTVFPGENLAVGGDPQQLQIARNSMQEMNSWGVTKGGNTENGFCKIFPIAARIGWPAEDLIAKFRAAILYQWRPSNLTVAQGGGGIETSGSIEALDSMLLQHEDGVLRVFPDWPLSRDASFVRLCAKGAFLVSSEVRNGSVTFVEIASEAGGPLTLQSPWGTAAVKVGGYRSVVVQPDAHGRIRLATKPGERYRITLR